MIVEIIVLLCFLGSLTGFFFFVKHYFKAWKAKSDNKKMLLAIESAEDEYAASDKFYHNILRNVDWGRIAIFTFIIGMAVIIFWNFATPNKDTSIGNQGQPAVINAAGGTGSEINNTINTINNSDDIFTTLTHQTTVPFWVFAVIGGIFIWIIFRNFMRHSYF